MKKSIILSIFTYALFITLFQNLESSDASDLLKEINALSKVEKQEEIACKNINSEKDIITCSNEHQGMAEEFRSEVEGAPSKDKLIFSALELGARNTKDILDALVVISKQIDSLKKTK